jgi:hypothetical protein
MAHQNTRSEKVKFYPHNRKAGVAKFKRNLGHRKRRRFDNRIRKSWVEERTSELYQPGSSTRDNGNNRRQRAEGEVPLA